MALSVIMQEAVRTKKVVVPCESYNAANSLRQRFYRHRDKIRQDVNDPLNLVIDSIHFAVDDRKLVITYDDTEEKLLEVLNSDDKSIGAHTPNESNQPDDVSSRQRQRSQTG